MTVAGTSRRCGKRDGFMLVEVICVLAITALMMGAIFGALSVTVRTVVRTRGVIRRSRIVSGIARVLRRDIEAAFGAEDGKLKPLEGGPAAGFGEEIVLALCTTNSLGPARKPSPTGLVRVQYILRPSERYPESRELLRRETPYRVGKPLDLSRSVAERLADGIAAWRLRFSDGTEWHDGWARSRLPFAVRLDVALQGEGTTAERMASVFLSPVVNPDANPLPLE